MKKIRIFTTPICPYCVNVKSFLKEKGFQFEEIDVSVNNEAAEEMVEKSGQMGVPVVDIDGEFVVGFDKAKISELLDIK